MTRTPNILAPTIDELDTMARASLELLPEELQQFTENVVIQVVDFPDEDVREELNLETPFDILGLYQGVSLNEKRIDNSGQLPDMVFLYRRPILDYWCETGEDLDRLVRHVLIHEIGHHFGYSDEDMEAIDAGIDEDNS